jgi:hypothetical protein
MTVMKVVVVSNIIYYYIVINIFLLISMEKNRAILYNYNLLMRSVHGFIGNLCCIPLKCADR